MISAGFDGHRRVGAMQAEAPRVACDMPVKLCGGGQQQANLRLV